MLLFWSLLTLCIALYVQDVSRMAAYGVVVFICELSLLQAGANGSQVAVLFTTGYAIAFTPLIVS
jgi:hypothetical protein